MNWLDLKEGNELAYINRENKKHVINFDKIFERGLRNVPDMNHKYVKKIEVVELFYLIFFII